MDQQPIDEQLKAQLEQLKAQLEEQYEEDLDAGLEHEGRIVYQIQESRSGKVHQAECAELLITAFGDSPEEARESLRTQVAQYLEDCDALGSLDEVRRVGGVRHASYPPPASWTVDNNLGCRRVSGSRLGGRYRRPL